MSRREFFSIITVVGLGLWSAYFLLPAYTDYSKTQRRLQNVEQELLEKRAEQEALNHDINELQSKSRAIERVAREKFGWSRPGESIYDFTQTNEQ